ncbi:DUF896 domain-containing protein [Clostridium paridis]|uniref:UPF0291 protein JK634_10960 n=1 Tax=Clostridium paridis TaxID=2803863 RepID=A0A937FHE5_9CLOT|nr:DUF896 domain-containing protein [Clostridium paridis]MBL4932327.1 DUF896 domain-containing protein [Clostridium paridis]
MNEDALIARINELYKKSKEEGLTDIEKEEQDKLRKKYIELVKNNFRAQLSGIKPKKKFNN